MNPVENLPADPFEENNFLGLVSQVGGSTVQVTVPRATVLPNGNSGQSSAARAEVGSFVIVACGAYGIVGQLTDVRVPNGQGQVSSNGNGNAGLNSIASVQLLTSINIESGEVTAGMMQVPVVGDSAFCAHPDLLQLIAETRHGSQKQEGEIIFSMAKLAGSVPTPMTFTPEMMFGRHCAVLGATGGGKSWSVARMVEECARVRSKVILFDATGEYGSLTKGVRHVYLGHDPEPRKGARQVVLPYYQLTENDLFSIFRPAGQSQAPKLRAAMKSLKLAVLEPSLAPDGTIIKADKGKHHFEMKYREHLASIETPFAAFKIEHLTRQIENECVRPNRSSTEPQFWGGIDGMEHSRCVPLVTRISDMIYSDELAPIFQPKNKRSVIKEIDEFFEDESTRVLCISLQHLSFAHHSREIIANAMGRHLLSIARDYRFQRQPLLVIVDEAHQFLNKQLGEESDLYSLDSFAEIAKEGRKYAMTICIATQRPRDIPEGVLSQMGTFLVHRLTNHHDRSVVERASGDIDESSVAALPVLAPGEAVLVGVAFPVPVRVKIEAPSNPPESSGPNFQDYWKPLSQW